MSASNASLSAIAAPQFVNFGGQLYRLGLEVAGTDGRLFGLVPVKEPIALPAIALPVPAETRPVAPREAPAVALAEEARLARQAIVANLFKREGADTLRAGHPDLWNLLVAGTSLAGSAFQSMDRPRS